MFIYKTEGTCAKEIHFETDGKTLEKVSFVGGCPGNILGLQKLLIGMEINKIIEMFQELPCGSRTTSCPAQLAQALKSMDKGEV